MTEPFQVGIIGLGAMGSSALYHLAQAGQNVIGFDRYLPPHQLGSSHGRTRVIREAYFEDPAYVPLLQRAYTLWAELETAAKTAGIAGPEPLLQLTGGLMIGPRDSELVKGCLASARQFHLDYELLDPGDLQAQVPMFKLSADFAAVSEPRTGYLHPEACIKTHLELAQRAGALIQAPCEVFGWQAIEKGFLIKTATGTVRVDKLVIAAGAWLERLVPELRLPLNVTRQALFWFEPKDAELFQLGKFPVFLLQIDQGRHLYGFPDEGEGFKVAVHAPGEAFDPDQLRGSEVRPEEREEIIELLRQYLPAAQGTLLKTAVCLYTNTPDQHFLIDQHPQHSDLLLLSPCSGHGFKFSSVVGEIAKNWALNQAQGQDLSLFSIKRLLG